MSPEQRAAQIADAIQSEFDEETAKRFLVFALPRMTALLSAAVAEERVRCATVVQRWKGPPSKTAMVRALVEGGEPGDEAAGYDPVLARQAATVDAFAAEMKARILENRAKGDWRGVDVLYLIARLLQENGELVGAVRVALEGAPAGRWPDLPGAVAEVRGKIRREAADAANLAMMVADVLGGFEREGEPPA